MNIKYAAIAAAVLGFSSIGAPAIATVSEPVPVDHYITFGGNDWAWASPCPPSGSGCGSGVPVDFSFQATQGWRLPTAAELLAGPTQNDFLDVNGAVICASAWFTTAYSHCDFGNPVYGGPGGDVWYAETWAIRGSVSGAVPEPATWAMLISGFAIAGAVMRRRATVAFA